MSRFFKFKPGDICITQNSSTGLLNNGLVVRILRIDPKMVGHRGESAPYLIGRVDAEPLPHTLALVDGDPRWYKARVAHCAEHKLRRLDPGDPGYPVYVTEEVDDVVESETTV